jgi:hypothetical protein
VKQPLAARSGSRRAICRRTLSTAAFVEREMSNGSSRPDPIEITCDTTSGHRDASALAK